MRNTCLNQIYELAKKDPRVVFIGSDLRLGTLQEFKDEFPDRYFMEGINEQNIIGMAAGLAMDGYIPYVNTIATFLTRRCYEQVALDICLHDLPVRLIANGGGLVYGPLGPTHTAIEDISLMRHLPNMAVVCPSDAEEMRQLMSQTLDYPHPMYIRIGKGFVDPVIEYRDNDDFMLGNIRRVKGDWENHSYDYLIISTGLTTDIAIKTKELLREKGKVSEVIHVPTIKPLNRGGEISNAISATKKCVIIIEEHIKNGGLGSAIMESCSAAYPITPVGFTGNRIRIKRFGIPDNFVKQYGTWDELMDICGLTPEKIVAVL